MTDFERRVMSGTVELRQTETGPGRLVGRSIPYGVRSEVHGSFQEVIEPGAATGVLGDDIRGLFNHDPSNILGRNVAGTMTLEERSDGVWFDITLPDTQVGRDVAVSVERGDITGNSFAFIAAEDRFEEDDDGLVLRTVTRFEALRDVGPVTYPFYQAATTVSKRAQDALERIQHKATPRRRLEAGLRLHRVRPIF